MDTWTIKNRSLQLLRYEEAVRKPEIILNYRPRDECSLQCVRKRWFGVIEFFEKMRYIFFNLARLVIKMKM